MYPFKLYNDAAYVISTVCYKIECFIFSKYIWPALALNFWIDAPKWFRRHARKSMKRLFRQLIIGPVFADRSKTLYERFRAKRIRKLSSILIALGDLYALQIVAWRKTVKYLRGEPWRHYFIKLSLALLMFHLSSYWFIYHSERVYRMHVCLEYPTFNKPDRFWHHRWPRRLNRRFKRWFMYCTQSPKSVNSWLLLSNSHGGWYRNLYSSSMFTYFTWDNWVWLHSVHIYTFIGVYYLFPVWHYNQVLYKSMRSHANCGYDAQKKTRACDRFGKIREEEIQNKIVRLLGEYAERLWFLTAKTPPIYLHSWNNEVKGEFYNFNTLFVEQQKLRRSYWLRRELLVSGKVEGNNWPCRDNEQTDAVILEYKERLKLDAAVRALKRKNRRLKNRWPLKNIRTWWYKLKPSNI